MADIKRYKPYDYETLHEPPLLGHDMAIDEEGEYVLYSDYEALKKREATLKAALSALVDAIKNNGYFSEWEWTNDDQTTKPMITVDGDIDGVVWSNAKAALNAERG